MIERRRTDLTGLVSSLSRETITITDGSLTTTKNLDEYFANIVDGWDTENILLILKTPHKYLQAKLVLANSKYASNDGLAGIYRMYNYKYQGVSRKDWIIKVQPGDVYYVVRLGTLEI